MKKLLFVGIIFLFGITACQNYTQPKSNQGTLTIADLQGCSHTSPYEGQLVEGVIGIVTAKVNNGFYLQSEISDSLDCTSDAIFVYTREYSDIVPGDKVRISGQIDEFNPDVANNLNLATTEIVNPVIEKISSGNKLPEPVLIGSGGRTVPHQIIDNDEFRKFDPEEDGIDFYESLESMLVRVSPGFVVGARNRHNEVIIIQSELFNENLISETGTLLQAEDDANPERIVLNLNKSNREKLNIGMQLIDEVMGIMEYSYGNFKVRVFGVPEFSSTTSSSQIFENANDDLSIATYNVENLSRFDEEKKFINLAEHIVAHMDSPDIVILHEVLDDSGVEDDGTVSSQLTMERLIGMIVKQGGPAYAVAGIDPLNNRDGGISGGNIRSVILYRSDRGISLVDEGKNSILTSNPMVIGNDARQFSSTRKPLVALFERGGNQFLILAAHLTSRGLDSPLFGNVQPIQRLEENKRIEQAELIYSFLAQVHSAYPEITIIIAGDLNDDSWSATLNTLRGNIFHDAALLIDESERYSYIYEGNAIQLDHILVSNPRIVTRFVILHLNSIFDHSLQVSDHDPVIVTLRFP